MNKQPTMEELIAKVEKLKSTGELDLSMEEDLSIAIMNLISLEEHFYFTAEKTGNNEGPRPKSARGSGKSQIRRCLGRISLQLRLLHVPEIKEG